MNIFEVFEKFNTQEKCISYLNIKRWGTEKPCCPYCDSNKVSTKSEKNQSNRYQCSSCQKSFTALVGTIFEGTKIPLQKWFLAVAMFLDAKKGISAKRLERNLNVNYKTAWRMLQQIRIFTGNQKEKELFDSLLGVDEIYIGGKPRKGKKDDDDMPKHGRGTSKIPVIGVVERKSGKVQAKVMTPNSKGQKLTGKPLLALIEEHTLKGSIVCTDEFRGYNILQRNLDFIHRVIDHQCEYSNGDIHTNNIGNFWSILKRGVYGIYHHISIKYMQRYINEFVFRV